ncbi:adenylyl-sulfate kinase, partial [Mycobacterium sp.]
RVVQEGKGLYKKVRAGQIKGFTGIDDPYEAPLKPARRPNGAAKSADPLAEEVIGYLEKVGVIPAGMT